MSSLLSVRDLTVDFRQDQQWHRVVDRLSFDIQPGEMVGIVGESGSGKTVSCRSLIQLLPLRTSRVTGQAIFGGEVDLDQLDIQPAGDKLVQDSLEGDLCHLVPMEDDQGFLYAYLAVHSLIVSVKIAALCHAHPGSVN